jgi:hypothetical protein
MRKTIAASTMESPQWKATATIKYEITMKSGETSTKKNTYETTYSIGTWPRKDARPF